MTIGELFIELGFKADTMKLKDFMRAVGELNMTSITTALGIGTLYEATAKIMGIADKTAMSIFGFTQVTGMAGKDMQQFANYAERMGVSTEDAQGSLKALQMALFNVKIGKGYIMPFALAGIDIAKDKIFTVIDKIQKFVKDPNVDPALKRMVVSASGLSENMIQVLKSSDQLSRSMQDMPFASPKEIQRIVAYHAELKALGQEMNLLFTLWGASLTPFIKSLEEIAADMVEIMRIGKGWGKLNEDIKNSWIGKVLDNIIPPLGAMRMIEDMAPKVRENTSKDLMSMGLQPRMAVATPSGAVTNDITVTVSGVEDPKKASDMVVDKLQRMLSDRFYHQKVQER